MSELLTTGQMIDHLKVGEVAEHMGDTHKGVHVTVNRYGGISFCDKDGNEKDTELAIVSQYKNSKWRILPTYVSFEEAMKALVAGKTVRIHSGFDMEVERMDYLRYFAVDRTWGELINANWSIEGDTP